MGVNTSPAYFNDFARGWRIVLKADKFIFFITPRSSKYTYCVNLGRSAITWSFSPGNQCRVDRCVTIIAPYTKSLASIVNQSDAVGVGVMESSSLHLNANRSWVQAKRFLPLGDGLRRRTGRHLIYVCALQLPVAIEQWMKKTRHSPPGSMAGRFKNKRTQPG